MERKLDHKQLSLEVGGEIDPLGSSFKVTGRLAVDDQLMRGSRVVVTIADEDGIVIAAAHGKVTGIGFKTHEPKDLPEWVERVHTIKLG